MLIDGCEVTLLRDGAEIFPAMLTAINLARTEVLLEMYWVGDDDVGRAFRSALTSAAHRGCEVRVIVDGIGSVGLPNGWWDGLIAAGGELLIYHSGVDPPQVSLLRALLGRDHRKLLIVDQGVAFIGGINLAQVWQPTALGGQGWRDTVLRLEGKETCQHLARLVEGTRQHLRQENPDNLAEVHAGPFGHQLHILANTPAVRRGRFIRGAYLAAIHRARKSIDITAAYFAPRLLFVHALVRAQKRGVRTRILLPWRSDLVLAAIASRPLVNYLIYQGVAVHAYKPTMLHAKTAVIDERWVTVGSHNLDALSWGLNLECNVVINDDSLGRAMTKMFEDDLAQSFLLSSAPRPHGIASRLKDILGTLMLAAYRWT